MRKTYLDAISELVQRAEGNGVTRYRTSPNLVPAAKSHSACTPDQRLCTAPEPL